MPPKRKSTAAAVAESEAGPSTASPLRRSTRRRTLQAEEVEAAETAAAEPEASLAPPAKRARTTKAATPKATPAKKAAEKPAPKATPKATAKTAKGKGRAVTEEVDAGEGPSTAAPAPAPTPATASRKRKADAAPEPAAPEPVTKKAKGKGKAPAKAKAKPKPKPKGKGKGKAVANSEDEESEESEEAEDALADASPTTVSAASPTEASIVKEEPDTTNVKKEGEEDDKSAATRQYWLLKAEPESRFENGVDVKFSIDDLRSCKAPEPWDGIRNYAARNNLRKMKKGDLAFFYHSNTKEPGIVGTMTIVQEHSPDLTAHDPKTAYYDPNAAADLAKGKEPKWSVVHVAFRSKFDTPITLKQLKEMGGPGQPLDKMQMLKQSRLSVSRVSAEEWKHLLGVAGAT